MRGWMGGMHCPKAPCPKSCSICIHEQAAQMLDSDGSGGLDCDEFCVAMRKLVRHCPRKYIDFQYFAPRPKSQH